MTNSDDLAIPCPKCGAVMVKRLAKRGANAGSYFYGCSRFPHCRGTRSIDEVEELFESDDGPSDNRPSILFSEINYPQELTARPRALGYQDIVFDSMAVPDDLLREVHSDTGVVGRDELLNFAKWRLDIPAATAHLNSVSRGCRSVLAVINKILGRGRLTRLSPSLEAKIMELFPNRHYHSDNIINSYRQYSAPNIPTQWHDGRPRPELDGMTPEQYFFKNIFVELVGAANARCIIPQVEFSSLVNVAIDDDDQPLLSQRVDFVITNGFKSLVVELDDSTHSGHEEKDARRDDLLQRSGYDVWRIDSSRLADKDNEALAELRGVLLDMFDNQPKPDRGDIDLRLIACKLAHQVQSTIATLCSVGVLDLQAKSVVAFNYRNIPELTPRTQGQIIRWAVSDLAELSKAIATVYRTESPLNNVSGVVATSDRYSDDWSVYVTVNDNVNMPVGRTVYVQDICFPTPIDQQMIGYWSEQSELDRPSGLTDDMLIHDNVTVHALLTIFNYLFRHDSFRENQLDGIAYGLNGEDAIILLPTGSGKSAIFQFLSFILPGVCCVVAPLVSLIEDQVYNLVKSGIDRIAGLSASTSNRPMIQRAIRRGQYLMVYSSPERFQIEEFRQAVSGYCAHGLVNICAIDEAHCVSEWGHDFRTSYLNLASTVRRLTTNSRGRATILALTGTASDAVLNDMVRDLAIPSDNIVRPSTFDRPELHFRIISTPSSEKPEVLRYLLARELPSVLHVSFGELYQPAGDKTMCGIVFCPHIGGDFGVDSVLRTVRQIGDDDTHILAKDYYGKQTKAVRRMSDDDWEQVKRSNAAGFKNNKFTVLVATKSFGMGIDKPNVRFTINYCLPQSIEEFYQEAGRGGRDKHDAYSYIIASNDYPTRNRQLLADSASIIDIVESSRRISRANSDDVTRVLYFHNESYSGIEADKAVARSIVSKVDFTSSRQAIMPPSDCSWDQAEKAVHRLVVLGVINDYVINYANREFVIEPNRYFDRSVVEQKYVEYVSSYQDDEQFVANKVARMKQIQADTAADFVAEAVGVLLEDFIYDTVEKSRRTTIRNLLTIVNDAEGVPVSQQDALIRRELLDFLSTTYAGELDKLNESPRDFQSVKNLIKRTRRQIGKLLAQINRSLQSHPDSPSLLLARLACLIQLYCRSSNDDVLSDARNSIRTIATDALEVYGMTPDIVADGLVWAIDELRRRHQAEYAMLVSELSAVEELRFYLSKLLPPKYNIIPSIFFISPILNQINSAVKERNYDGQ